jgi:biofilm PGA synthesis N-glycosyltransferase PgaC
LSWVFWGSLLVVCYTYVGYWLLLRLTAGRLPVVEQASAVSVSILLIARNEATRLPAKLKDIRSQRYSGDRQIIVVSDGSTDGTNEYLYSQPDVLTLALSSSGGKALALNEAARHATGDLLVFFDARQRIPDDVLEQLTHPFADPTVGAVSGELLLLRADGAPDPDALGLYWKIEKSIRQLESLSGSVVGVTGAIYAMRRELFTPLPAGLILDDVWLPMHAARAGHRVLFQPTAVATDVLFTDPGKEFRRKVRTLTGNFELVRKAPWLLSPANPLLFRFISHKLLRLMVPYLLLIMLLSSAMAQGRFYRLAFAAQLVFFGLAALGAFAVNTRRWRVVSVAYTFTMLNAAAVAALYKFVARKHVWT